MSGDLKSDSDRKSVRKKRRSVVTRNMERPPEANPNYVGNNGGKLKDSTFYKRDIYGDLEKIEERGKKKRGWLSLFGEKNKN